MGIGILDDIQKELKKAGATRGKSRKRLPPMFGPEPGKTAAMGAGKRRPTKVERMLLVAAAAQLIAGPRKNPSKAQIARAMKAVDARIAKETAMSGSDVVGGFWDNVKNLAKSAGSAAVRVAPAVFGWVAKNPQIVLPLAGAAVASPFLISAISAASQSPQAAQEAAAGPPPPPPDGVPVATVAPPAPPAEQVEEVLGTQPSWDERGDAVVGEITEEEAALADSGGATERESMERLRGTSVMGGPVVHHDLYRAAILADAAKLAKGGAPQTRHFYLAKKLMDRRLQKKGAKVAIPGARPGRRTR